METKQNGEDYKKSDICCVSYQCYSFLCTDWIRYSFSRLELVGKYSNTDHALYYLLTLTCYIFERIEMKFKTLLFWLCLTAWEFLAVLVTIFTYDYAKESWLTLSYFWCGLFAISCGVGTIIFPVVTMINLIFTQERK